VDKLSDHIFIGNKDLDYVKLINEEGNPAPKEVVEKIVSLSAFKKSIRTVIPFAPFFKDPHWWSNLNAWRFLFSGDGQNWFVVGDNPIITRGIADNDPVNCLREFIFPVSGKILLISGNNKTSPTLPPAFTVQFGAAIIERSHRFVACQDQSFLESLWDLHKMYVSHYKSSIIIKELFDMLDEK